MASDFIDLGEVDLDRLDVHGLLALARTIGIVPIAVGGESPTTEVLKRKLKQYAMSA